jgi:hypothetical protein
MKSLYTFLKVNVIAKYTNLVDFQTMEKNFISPSKEIVVCHIPLLELILKI